MSCSSFAQLALSHAGALAALNNNSSSPTPPSHAAVNPVSLVTIGITNPPITKPINPKIIVIPQQPINDKALWFTYRSPLTWWSAFFNYQTAAEGVNLGIFEKLAHPDVTVAMAFYENTNNFIPLQSYTPRKTTMIVRANQPVPVQFAQTQNINNASVSFKEYVPRVSGFYAEVPLNFLGQIIVPLH